MQSRNLFADTTFKIIKLSPSTQRNRRNKSRKYHFGRLTLDLLGSSRAAKSLRFLDSTLSKRIIYERFLISEVTRLFFLSAFSESLQSFLLSDRFQLTLISRSSASSTSSGCRWTSIEHQVEALMIRFPLLLLWLIGEAINFNLTATHFRRKGSGEKTTLV